MDNQNLQVKNEEFTARINDEYTVNIKALVRLHERYGQIIQIQYQIDNFIRMTNKRSLSIYVQKFLFFGFCLSLLTINSFGQHHSYYFRAWKGRFQIPAKQIILLVDSAHTIEGTQFLINVTNELNENLTKAGFGCKVTTDSMISDMDDIKNICFVFMLDRPAYVQLNIFEAGIPCNRIKMIQKRPDTKQRIETEISISVDRQLEGIKQLGIALSDKMKSYLILEK